MNPAKYPQHQPHIYHADTGVYIASLNLLYNSF